MIFRALSWGKQARESGIFELLSTHSLLLLGMTKSFYPISITPKAQYPSCSLPFYSRLVSGSPAVSKSGRRGMGDQIDEKQTLRCSILNEIKRKGTIGKGTPRMSPSILIGLGLTRFKEDSGAFALSYKKDYVNI
ncbi:hypothetical protein EVAR_24253_1 [Eumeta japonica]|uniref:Uncharacterized protein n=1 Tax=Eumeta variegata TaxID=151549 RepID=A0A4C1VFN5_EUMVA|nr:hypothetical protein EVAR_24253_1 [Eumeta japonica]